MIKVQNLFIENIPKPGEEISKGINFKINELCYSLFKIKNT